MKNRIKITFNVVLLLTVFFVLTGCNNVNNSVNNKDNISSQESGEIEQETDNINNTNNVTINSNINNNKGNNNTNNEINNDYVLNDIDLSLMEQRIIDIANITNPKILKDNEASELYDLSGFNGAKSLIIIDEHGDNYQEIALINLASQEQEDKIIEKFIMRYEQLKLEKPGNTIITTKSNIVIKQQAGVGIFIVSKNINKLQEEINNNM